MKVPNGCLIIQAGKTFENITGGYVLSGLHEVFYSEGTKTNYEKGVAEGKIAWRVSSTMFTHFRNNVDCSPMPQLKNYHIESAEEKYGKMTAYDILMEELNATNMIDGEL